MISNTAQLNTFVGGMNLDSDINMIPENSYRYAENVHVVTNDGGTTGVLQNIEGVRKYSAHIPADEIIIGTTTIDDIGVVITKCIDSINKVYKITGLDTNIPTIDVVCKGRFNLCSSTDITHTVCVVANKEAEDNIKIYFTDGNNQTKVLNIMSDKYSEGSDLVDSDGNMLNPDILDITPSATLNPMEFVGMSNGSLPSGTVSYCYQLFNVCGTETVVSPLSEMIHLTDYSSSQGSKTYKGTSVLQASNRAVILRTKINTSDFGMCRVMRILYRDNTSLPTISIIDEVELTKDTDTFIYTDYGSSFLSELTVDEFNAITGYQFIAQTLTKMQNRLFAANVKEISWNPKQANGKPYDARAYRANEHGTVKLLSADRSNNLQFAIQNSVYMANISPTHDCINPFNNVDYAEVPDSEIYIYDILGRLGGTGINISYNFVTTDVVLSKQQNQRRLDLDCTMDVPAKIISKHIINWVNSVFSKEELVNTLINDARIPNYADPYIAAKYRGYMRDEVYRFGIVFYNEKNIASPVLWIGDIRMPKSTLVPAFVYENNTLIGKALGIDFVVKDMPKGAVSYEIVRCDRTQSDRTIISQVVGNCPLKYAINETDEPVGEGKRNDGSIEMRPTPFFYNGNRQFTIRNKGVNAMNYSTASQLDYFRMVSPEICIQGKEIEKLFENSTYMDLLGYFYTPFVGGEYFHYIGGDGEGVLETVDYSNFATARTIKHPDGSSQYINSVVALLTDLEYASDIFAIPYLDKNGNKAYYHALVAKYFFPHYVNTYKKIKAKIEDAKYAMDVPYNVTNNLSAYTINVGNKTYTNYSMSAFFDPGYQTLIGPAGPCIVAHVPDLKEHFKQLENEHNIAGLISGDRATAIPIFNIKRVAATQYGGNTYTSRSNSIYISTASVNSKVNVHNTTFGGDTYLSLLDYPNTMIFQRPDLADRENLKYFIASYIPFESTINMNLFQGDQVHRTVTANGFVDAYLQLNPTQMLTFHSQDNPYFLYNSAYSARNTVKKFVPKSLYSKDDLSFTNRIHVSQAKTNNEVLDKWSKFKIADYLDVDNQYGKITNIRVFKNRLFYFQDSGVGIAAVNERSLITDDNINQLVLGTGGILSRYDYITDTNGSSIINDRSIVNSDNVMYWYDYDKNELCAYNGNVNPISKLKYVQTYLNSIYKDNRTVVSSLFDKKYNEVWFRFLDKSLIFNEQIDRFTSFYTFAPLWSLPFSNRVVSIKDNKLYSINDTNTSGEDTESIDAKLQIVINKDFALTKVFDNVRLHGNFKDEHGKLIVDGIVEYLKFDTKHQQAIKDNSKEPIIFDYREDTYRIPVPRADVNEDEYSLPARLRGKTMICEYHFDKQKHHTFEIPQITTTYRHSRI